jgi:hypothetical protein
LGQAKKIISWAIGIIIAIFGFMVLGASFMMPILFAGQYMIISFILIIAAVVLIYLGNRSK